MAENEVHKQKQQSDANTHETKWLPPHLRALKEPANPVKKPLAAQSSSQHNASPSAQTHPDHHKNNVVMSTAGRISTRPRFEEGISGGAFPSDPRSNSLNSQTWNSIMSEPKPALKPGLDKSIWAPQKPAEPDPRDEDFTPLFNYKKKKIVHEIPVWLRKKIEPTAPAKQPNETPRNNLAQLQASMHNPANHRASPTGYVAPDFLNSLQVTKDPKPTEDSASDYLNEMGGAKESMDPSKVTEKVDGDLIAWD